MTDDTRQRNFAIGILRRTSLDFTDGIRVGSTKGHQEPPQAQSFVQRSSDGVDPLSITVSDPDHSIQERRYLTIGTSDRLRPLIVAHTELGNRVRIISARQLTSDEREAYEEEIHD